MHRFCNTALLVVAASASTAPPPELHRLLFIDQTLFHNISSGLTLRLEVPRKTAPVLEPTKPWEDASGYYYNTVVRINATTVFLYYDCGPRGTSDLGLRFTCLAISSNVSAQPILGTSMHSRTLIQDHWTPSIRRAASHSSSRRWVLRNTTVLLQTTSSGR